MTDAIRHETATLQGVGGVTLHTQAWLPATAPRAAVVLVHGLGEHSSRYGHVAEAFVNAGYAVHAFDHRGHGRSEGRRVQVERFSELTDDLGMFRAQVAAQHPGIPLFIVGHSMGGLVALAHVAQNQEGLAGLVVSGTAAQPDNISAATIAVGRVVARVAPNAGVAKLQLDRVSSDPSVVRAYFDDPLISKGKVRARMGAEILDAIATVDGAAPAINVPILILHGGDDVIAPASASRRLHERIGSTDKELIVYDGLWHEIFNEPQRDAVLGDVRRWLDSHLVAAQTPAQLV